MTLIYLLLALFAERVISKPESCHSNYYIDQYIDWLNRKDYLTQSVSVTVLWLMWLIPGALLVITLMMIDIGVIDFVVTVFVLYMAIGCPELRNTYKCYLEAASRGDMETCDRYTQQLGLGMYEPRTFGQHLIWLNYQRYAAPMIMFVVFGLYGVVAYGCLRALHGYSQAHTLQAQTSLTKALHVIDWLPIRITAFGFLLVGHFSNALPKWIGLLFDTSTHAKLVLAEVAVAAEDVAYKEGDITTEPTTLVQLAKRNVLFIVSIVAVLTLSGIIA
ncbi:MAG: Uncharacterised protein [Glaciecola sp. HTCC2999]|jgi:AmpE protein|nr:MAG: Uncharacterised protein [Glaciecola sp. HTCC2999]